MTDAIRVVPHVAELEELVLRHAWYECDSFGLKEGGFTFGDAVVSVAVLAEMTGHEPESARNFVLDDVGLVEGDGGGDHWEAMLEDDFSDDSELSPVLLLTSESWEVLDGNHRCAGYVANGGDDVGIVIGIENGIDVELALARYELARLSVAGVSSPSPSP